MYYSLLTHHDVISAQSFNILYNICLIVATIIAKKLCFVNNGYDNTKNNRGGGWLNLSKWGRQSEYCMLK